MDRPSPTAYLFLVSCCVLFFTSAAQSARTDSARLQLLNQLQRSNRDGLIPINAELFETFIESAPRSYGVAIIFTAPPRMCQVCKPFISLFSHVSSEYYKLSSSKAAKKPLFFAHLLLSERDQQFLAKYRIRHVPILYYFPPGSSKFAQPLEETSPNQYPMQQLRQGSNSIREFINARTGSRMNLVRGNYKIPFVETVRQFMPLIVILVFTCAALSIYTGIYKNPMFWFGLVVLVYIFSVGGGHYSWIHNVPLAVVDMEGHTQYIADGSRSQYVAEGFFVSATCVSISVLVILIQELPSAMPNKEAQTLAGAVLFIMTVFAITALLVMYHFKMPQYLQYNELS